MFDAGHADGGLRTIAAASATGMRIRNPTRSESAI
jgi:hypothetical protein